MPYLFLSSAAVSLILCALRAAIINLEPFFANAAAISFPNPLYAPVTNTVLFFSCVIIYKNSDINQSKISILSDILADINEENGKISQYLALNCNLLSRYLG